MAQAEIHENRAPWQQTLNLLQDVLSATSFETWFKPLKIMAQTKDKMVLGTEDPLALANLKKRYHTLVSNAVKEAYGHEYEIVFMNSKDPLPPDMVKTMPDANATQFNPKYTFETFVVGASNRFAHAASLAVAELPSDAYNPLFLYGGVGLGKTHLMHAIGHFILRENPNTKLMYITSESFTNELIAAIARKTNHELRDRLRNVDVLMVDDIQFIAGKTATQEEFFHTFNQLHSSGKQIIISSDRPPKDIPTLEERLRSRFEWGLIADVQKPDYETRIAILRKKAEIEGIDVPDDVLNYIAEIVQSNIRELEGSLILVNAKSSLNREPITLALARDALESIVRVKEEREITPELIIKIISGYYHIENADFLSQRRNREIALPRQIAMFLAREMTGHSTTRIGDIFGGRDHTTVMHACEKIGGSIKENATMAATVDQLRALINEA